MDCLNNALKNHGSGSDVVNKFNDGEIAEYAAAISIMKNKAAPVPSLSNCITMRLIL